MTSRFGRLAAVSLALASTPALAGPLAISPTTIEIAADRRSAVLEVANASDAPVDLQIRAFAWAQEAGEERLTPTDALVVSPPIVTIAAGTKQVFRVLSVSHDPRATERSFRLKLNELPRPGSAVKINLEFSLPVFELAKNATPQLTAERDGDALVVANTGGRRIRIARLAVAAGAGGETEIEGARSAYLLSGATKRFKIPASAGATLAGWVTGTGDVGPIDAPLVVLASR